MCVIIGCNRAKPDLDLLLKAEAANPDGGGIAWIENGKVFWIKDIAAEEIMKISKNKALPQLIHFRIATAGGKSSQLCHPFPVHGGLDLSGSANAVLAHNGHIMNWEWALSLYKEKLPKGPWSDTRLLAVIAGKKDKNRRDSFFKGLAKQHNYVAMLDCHSGLKAWGDDWKSYKGMALSNDYFLRPTLAPYFERVNHEKELTLYDQVRLGRGYDYDCF